MRKILAIFMMFMALNLSDSLILAEEGLSQEAQSKPLLTENEWIKNHHGVIIYQDYHSDRYSMLELIRLARELGTDIVKTWLKGNEPGKIPGIVKSPEYREMFDSFGTICLNVCPEYILYGKYTSGVREAVQSDFYNLTKFIIKHYDGQGKTFIINYFFEMNVYLGTAPSGRPDFPVVDFVSDAQSGVKKAMRESVTKDIKILDSIEVNCDHDFFNFVKNVFPKVNVDLYSVSFYGYGTLAAKLDHWAKYAPDNEFFKGKNIIVGEYGRKMEDVRVKGDEEAQSRYFKEIRKEAREWGVPYIFLFWLADQDSKVKSEGQFGLIDLKGHKRKAWSDLHNAYCLPDALANPL